MLTSSNPRDMENIPALPSKIKKLREKKGLSQERFGNKIGVSGKSISAYEKGRCVPPTKVLETISKVYNVPAFYICDTNKNDLSTIISEIKLRVGKIEEILESNITV